MTTTFSKKFLTITAAIMRKALIFSQCEINEIIYDGNNKQALFTYLQRHIIIKKNNINQGSNSQNRTPKKHYTIYVSLPPWQSSSYSLHLYCP